MTSTDTRATSRTVSQASPLRDAIGAIQFTISSDGKLVLKGKDAKETKASNCTIVSGDFTFEIAVGDKGLVGSPVTLKAKKTTEPKKYLDLAGLQDARLALQGETAKGEAPENFRKGQTIDQLGFKKVTAGTYRVAFDQGQQPASAAGAAEGFGRAVYRLDAQMETGGNGGPRVAPADVAYELDGATVGGSDGSDQILRGAANVVDPELIQIDFASDPLGVSGVGGNDQQDSSGEPFASPEGGLARNEASGLPQADLLTLENCQPGVTYQAMPSGNFATIIDTIPRQKAKALVVIVYQDDKRAIVGISTVSMDAANREISQGSLNVTTGMSHSESFVPATASELQPGLYLMGPLILEGPATQKFQGLHPKVYSPEQPPRAIVSAYQADQSGGADTLKLIVIPGTRAIQPYLDVLQILGSRELVETPPPFQDQPEVTPVAMVQAWRAGFQPNFAWTDRGLRIAGKINSGKINLNLTPVASKIPKLP